MKPKPIRHEQPIALIRVTQRDLGKVQLLFWEATSPEGKSKTFIGRACHMRALRWARTGT